MFLVYLVSGMSGLRWRMLQFVRKYRILLNNLQTADMKAFLTAFRTDISSATTFGLETLDDGLDPQNMCELMMSQITIGLTDDCL